MSNEAPEGLIWKIDRNATHDGPGIRTLLFFKGCPLSCRWCSNPEGQAAGPELIFRRSECTDCGLCLEVCPRGALSRREPSAIDIDRSACDACGDCMAACPTGALHLWGQRYSVPEIVELLEKDRTLHRQSGGGLSCTGGEPLYQPAFLRELLAQCRRRGIHTVVETSALADEKHFRAMLEMVDWLYIDLKHTDPAKHRELTEVNNDLILRNTRLASARLQERGKTLVVRQVLVPGITDGPNITALADFLASLPFLSGVELLAYHNYGTGKYELLGRRYALPEISPPSAGEMEKAKEQLRARGIHVM
ncbi:MAG: glycyl-radical enzyme activating protein [Chloroflexota bacterium]